MLRKLASSSDEEHPHPAARIVKGHDADKQPHTSYRLVVEGEGRGGFVKGSSAIALRPEGDTTIVDVTGTVQTGGPIARVGQRLISGVAKMMMDKFFACLQGKV